jgi:hypothetical protein
MMQKIAIVLATAVIATGGLTLDASARVIPRNPARPIGAPHGPVYENGTIPTHWWQTRNPFYLYYPNPPRIRHGYGGASVPHYRRHGTRIGHGGIYGPTTFGFHRGLPTGTPGGVYGGASFMTRPRGGFRRRYTLFTSPPENPSD